MLSNFFFRLRAFNDLECHLKKFLKQRKHNFLFIGLVKHEKTAYESMGYPIWLVQKIVSISNSICVTTCTIRHLIGRSTSKKASVCFILNYDLSLNSLDTISYDDIVFWCLFSHLADFCLILSLAAIQWQLLRRLIANMQHNINFANPIHIVFYT